jgi:ABC-type phosphate transport system ATPase subunit
MPKNGKSGKMKSSNSMEEQYKELDEVKIDIEFLKTQRERVTFVVGPPCSGKSTFVRNLNEGASYDSY